MVKVIIEGQEITIELDTGATVSIISVGWLYKEF